MDSNGASGQPQYGQLTYTDLTATGAFFRPAAPDPWGGERAAFSPGLARMSAELAANVYSLTVAPWARAGWTDCAFVVEDRVVALDRDSDSKLAAIEAEWKRRRARSLIRGVRPFGDLLRAIRQLLTTDMGKTVVMTRLLPDGRAVIAVSFIGTTQKYFDWFTNFKLHPSGGMHAGFLELARQFDAQSSRIVLPAAAAALGRNALTLADALREASRPGNPFTFWLSGHSQGGALVQTYAHLLLERGVAPDGIRAYSFAAPTVTAEGGVADPKAYPIYNIENGDDVVPRVGGQAHLGVDCVFAPDDAFRARHYRVPEELGEAFDRMLFVSGQVRSTQDALCMGVALMRIARRAGRDEEAARFFYGLVPRLAILRRVGLESEEVARIVEEKMAGYSRDFFGREPDACLCDRYGEMLHVAVRTFGAENAARALTRSLTAPHRIQPDKREEAFVPPYAAIVRRHLDEMDRYVWLAGTPPRRVDARGETPRVAPPCPAREDAALPP